MAKHEPYIEVNDSTTSAVSTSPTKKFGKRLGNLENLTQAVLWVGISTIVAVLVTCCALVLDQMHFNNQTYREQSRLDDEQFKALQKQNDALQRQLNLLSKRLEDEAGK